MWQKVWGSAAVLNTFAARKANFSYITKTKNNIMKKTFLLSVALLATVAMNAQSNLALEKTAIATTGAEGNHLMDSSLISLYKQRKISSDTAIRAAHDREYVRRSTLF